MLCGTRSASQICLINRLTQSEQHGGREGDMGDYFYMKTFNTFKGHLIDKSGVYKQKGESEVVTQEASLSLNG